MRESVQRRLEKLEAHQPPPASPYDVLDPWLAGLTTDELMHLGGKRDTPERRVLWKRGFTLLRTAGGPVPPDADDAA